ncbi:MAG: glycosyltransferase [Lachnospiraceae bacterium]|nr:glycosyltransferase [Lachnospiraceae bacterium]
MSHISVIIPVYNTKPEYLSACLESVINQTERRLRIIAVDDGSSDPVPAILDRYAAGDARLKVIHQKNGGTSVARNAGLNAAEGNYILFLDADDYLERDCCEKALSAMEEKAVDMLFFGYSTNYTNRELKRVLKNPDPGLFEREALELSILGGDRRLGGVEVGAPWGKLIRRSCIEENSVRYTPGLKKGQDTVFNLNLLEHCESFAYLPLPLYHYRISEVSVSHRYNPEIVDIMEKTCGAYREFVDKYGKGEIFRRSLKRKYWKILTGEYCSLYFVHPKNPLPEEEREKEYLKLTLREPYRSAVASEAEEAGGLWERLLLSCVEKGRIGSLFRLIRIRNAVFNRLIQRFG